jgi:hypothetical protein
LLISAKAQGVDPQAYLKDLIEKLPEASPSNLVRRLESLAVDFGILKSCASGVISPILTPTSSL